MNVTVRGAASDVIRAAAATPHDRRYLLGVTGIPAAGKTTFARQLTVCINDQPGQTLAVTVPMDGFHYPNAVLEQRGIRPLKGVPETFDAPAFVALLKELRDCPTRTVGWPDFDRGLDEPVPNAIAVTSGQRIVVVEGNYLLVDHGPWSQVREILDAVWYLDAPEEVAHRRLLERHVQGGRDEQQAQAKIRGTDLPNARLIESTRRYADRIVIIRDT